MHVSVLDTEGYLDKPKDNSFPTRDEILDAYDVLIRANVKQLRPALDGVYEAGYADAVRTLGKKNR